METNPVVQLHEDKDFDSFLASGRRIEKNDLKYLYVGKKIHGLAETLGNKLVDRIMDKAAEGMLSTNIHITPFILHWIRHEQPERYQIGMDNTIYLDKDNPYYSVSMEHLAPKVIEHARRYFSDSIKFIRSKNNSSEWTLDVVWADI